MKSPAGGEGSTSASANAILIPAGIALSTESFVEQEDSALPLPSKSAPKIPRPTCKMALKKAARDLVKVNNGSDRVMTMMMTMMMLLIMMVVVMMLHYDLDGSYGGGDDENDDNDCWLCLLLHRAARCNCSDCASRLFISRCCTSEVQK